MYRLFVLALVMTLTMAFSGCGPKQEATTPTESDTAAPAEQSAETPPATAPESGAEAAGSEEATGSDESAAAEEEDWGEFEVVPSASASAQKKE